MIDEENITNNEQDAINAHRDIVVNAMIVGASKKLILVQQQQCRAGDDECVTWRMTHDKHRLHTAKVTPFYIPTWAEVIHTQTPTNDISTFNV